MEGMNIQKYALGLPRNSVRAILAILLVTGFIAINCYVAYGVMEKQLELDKAIGLMGIYTPILTTALIFYYKTRETDDKDGNNGGNGNGSK
jgi:hypothetical protein